MSTVTLPTPATCKHDRFKFTSIGGHLMCEMCARIEAKWEECSDWACSELVPPDRRRCDAHGGAEIVECEDCSGAGEVHVDCTTCDGSGEVLDSCEVCGGEGEIDRRAS